jgi:hypothetical protein
MCLTKFFCQAGTIKKVDKNITNLNLNFFFRPGGPLEQTLRHVQYFSM